VFCTSPPLRSPTVDAEELCLEERNVAIARSMASLHRETRSSAAVPPLASVYSLSTRFFIVS